MSSILERSTLHPVPAAATVPRELHGLLVGAGFRDRQLVALAARLGLADGRPATLAAAGARAGYTRERVRQLEERLRELRGPLPATARALRAIEQAAPAPLAQVNAELARLGLAHSSFAVGAVLRAADVLGLDHDASLLGAAVLRPADRRVSAQSLLLARRLVRRDGVGHVDRIDAAEQTLLHLRSEPIWLDRRRTWFFVRGVESRAGLLLRKMLSSCSSLTFAQVADGFHRAPRPIVAPPGVVASMCETYPWLVVDRTARTVTRKVALDSAHAHSPVERTILEIFAEHGPAMRFSDVIARGAGRGLNRASVAVYLTRMPSVIRLRRGVYAVRGAA